MKIHHPKLGDTRIKSGFLFLPRCINHETRWLEKATWQERYGEYLSFGPGNGMPIPMPGWLHDKWIK